MKNRKSVIVAFLLVATLLLGVGYAALSDELYINGDGSVLASNFADEFEEDIYFSAASAPTGCTASVDSSDNDKATFNIPNSVLVNLNDKVTFTFTVKNESDLPALLTETAVTNSNTEYFKVTHDGDNVTVSAGGTKDITVTVELIKTPDEDQNATFALTYKATSVDTTP